MINRPELVDFGKELSPADVKLVFEVVDQKVKLLRSNIDLVGHFYFSVNGVIFIRFWPNYCFSGLLSVQLKLVKLMTGVGLRVEGGVDLLGELFKAKFVGFQTVQILVQLDLVSDVFYNDNPHLCLFHLDLLFPYLYKLLLLF